MPSTAAKVAEQRRVPEGMHAHCFARCGPEPTRMVTMSAIPPRLRPLLDAGFARAAAGAPAHRRGPRVLPRRRQRARRLPRPRPARRRGRRRRPHDRRPPRRRRGDSCGRGPTRSGCRASASAPSGVARTARCSRSRRSAPRCTGPRAASPRSCSPTTSRPTSRAATSPSTRWRCGSPSRSSSIRSAARSTSPRAGLRTPLAPEVSFLDDPLRMLRAARFIAQFGLVPDPALTDAVVELRHRLEIVSAERIRDELSKLLLVDDPSAGLWFLAETGLVRRVPARAQPDAPRAGPDPHPQGRARAHHRGGAQHAARAAGAARRAVPRRRQAEDPVVRRRRRELPPPRGGRRAHDRGAACGR